MPTPPGPAAAGSSAGMKLGLVLIGGLLVGGVVGYGAGRATTGSPLIPSSGGSKGGSYAEGYAAAEQKLKDAGVIPSAAIEVRNIFGAVTSVGDASLVMETNLRSPNPLDERQPPTSRTVNVTSETKIVRQTAKDPAEFRAEMEAFQQAADPTKPFPQPFNVETITLADIKAGDQVSVTADHDIFGEASFDATEINVASNAAAAVGGQAPPPPPPPPQQ
jgi:hypothetical protein